MAYNLVTNRIYRKRKQDQGFCSRCSIKVRVKGKKTCKDCLKRALARQKEWREKGLCSACGNPKFENKASCSSCLLKYRIRRLKKLGLPEEELEKVLVALENHQEKCDSCGVLQPGGNGEWCLDHDDLRKIFRGILCCSCNTIIGHAKDDLNKLKKAILYLKKFL